MLWVTLFSLLMTIVSGYRMYISRDEMMAYTYKPKDGLKAYFPEETLAEDEVDSALSRAWEDSRAEDAVEDFQKNLRKDCDCELTVGAFWNILVSWLLTLHPKFGLKCSREATLRMGG